MQAAPIYDAETQAKLHEWVMCKRTKDFATADAIRKELRAVGIDPDTVRPDFMKLGAGSNPQPCVLPGLPPASAAGGVDPQTRAKLDRWLAAKRMKDYETADVIRKELRAKGIDPEILRPADFVRQGCASALNALPGGFDPQTQAKLDQWVTAKRMKDYKTADDIRKELRAKGVDPDIVRPSDKVLARQGGASTLNSTIAALMKLTTIVRGPAHFHRRAAGNSVPDGAGAKCSDQTAGQALLEDSSSVIIRSIAPSVSAEELQEMLDRVGTVKSLTMVVAAESDRASQVGVCEFEDVETAKEAVEALEGTELDGMELKLTCCKKVAAAFSEEVRRSFPSESSAAGQSSAIPGALVVDGLSQKTTSDSLQAVFSEYGTCQARVFMNEGFGLVHFHAHEDAMSALREEHVVDEQPVEVSLAFHGQYDSALPPRIPGRLFVGGLADDTTSETLQDAFSKYGACEAEVVIDEESGRSRGFGFLTFDSPEEADAVLQEEEHIVDDTTVEVKECEAPTDRRSDQAANSSRKLLVGWLSQGTTSDSLRAAFSKYGQCEAELIMNDDHMGGSRGFGRVTFQTESEARAALEVKSVDGQQVTCSFSPSAEGGQSKGSGVPQPREPPATIPAILPPQAALQHRLPNTMPPHGLQHPRQHEVLINALKHIMEAKGELSGPPQPAPQRLASLQPPGSSRSAACIPELPGMPRSARFPHSPYGLPPSASLYPQQGQPQAAIPHPPHDPPPATPHYLPPPQWPPAGPLQTVPPPTRGPPGSFAPSGYPSHPPWEPPPPPPLMAPPAPARPSCRAPSSRAQESLDNSSNPSSFVDAAPAVREKRVRKRRAEDSQGHPHKSSRPSIKPSAKPSLAPHLQ
eukprot:TRINITY_DN73111_c0_g1_i1.p1 TRINITY_DN73111_c0_g1~~TRINITY_DN73111_c0_g1_i1.p1  ORF type:complete len:863 (+),score=139.61 TRINITY_DN73111_c0_g1_i1:83-2671(+)